MQVGYLTLPLGVGLGVGVGVGVGVREREADHAGLMLCKVQVRSLYAHV